MMVSEQHPFCSSLASGFFLGGERPMHPISLQAANFSPSSPPHFKPTPPSSAPQVLIIAVICHCWAKHPKGHNLPQRAAEAQPSPQLTPAALHYLPRLVRQESWGKVRKQQPSWGLVMPGGALKENWLRKTRVELKTRDSQGWKGNWAWQGTLWSPRMHKPCPNIPLELANKEMLQKPFNSLPPGSLHSQSPGCWAAGCRPLADEDELFPLLSFCSSFLFFFSCLSSQGFVKLPFPMASQCYV